MNEDYFDDDVMDILEQHELEEMNIPDEQLYAEPPENLINNQVARTKQLCFIVLLYFHAKHGEPVLNELCDENQIFIETQNESIHFNVE